MLIALWIVNALALAFAGASIPKLVLSKDRVVAPGQNGEWLVEAQTRSSTTIQCPKFSTGRG